MFKRKFTTVTQLHEKNNKNIINYIESARGTYAQALRKTFYVVKIVQILINPATTPTFKKPMGF